jgi:glycosyltransferase involved in cell wall biosynthesis
MNVSVIICTHNPRPDYLRRTLDGLRAQTLPCPQWEIIIIDNASTAPVAANGDLSWHPEARVLMESQLGLTPARLRGIRESCAPLLVFVDDDNILAPDFLQQALAIAAKHPHLGAFGAGVLEPEFERQPTSEVVPLLHRLALRTARTDLWSNNLHDNDCCPWGAGLCVRRETAVRFTELVSRVMVNGILDRKGQQLTSNGDDLFTWAAVSVGQGFGIFTALRITHLIDARRVSPEYMVRLVRDSRVSECVLYFLLEGIRPRPMSLLMLVRVASYLRKGLFALRCRWAAAQGEGRAARFIVEHQLQPI